jgi:LDH2 family malate/lactate/ureidoglycolate dehydrogenase
MAADATSTQRQVFVYAEDAISFAEAVLRGNGVSADDATIIADALVQADLRGLGSHGINRLPSYMARIRHGVLDPTAQPTVKTVTPVVSLVSL